MHGWLHVNPIGIQFALKDPLRRTKNEIGINYGLPQVIFDYRFLFFSTLETNAVTLARSIFLLVAFRIFFDAVIALTFATE